MIDIGTTKERDYTPTGLKEDGIYENDRNSDASALFKAILREVYGPGDVIIGHHIIHVARDKRDGFVFEVVQEIPSADALIFDHEIAAKLWGPEWPYILSQLACEPTASRDALLARLFANRYPTTKSPLQLNEPNGFDVVNDYHG